MTPASTTHLSEEALDDVLIGLGSAASHAHLEACAECRSRTTTVRGDIALFNAASMAWSESRRPLARVSVPNARRVPAALLGWVTAAAAMVAMAFGIWHYRAENPASQANTHTVQPAQPADTEAQIAQDNQLLKDVNAAISTDEASPIDEYKILESPSPHSKAHSTTRTK